jgi:glycerol kinase
MSVLVIDVGTSGLRAAVVTPEGRVDHARYAPLPPSSPFPGLVEFDAAAMSDAVMGVASAALAEAGTVDAVGIATQRASTVLWDRSSGIPIAPALGWQDLRTVTECIMAKAEHGLALAPNQSATKIAWLLDHVEGLRGRDLCFGTVDTWIAWVLSQGQLHVTDRTNAGVTGLYDISADGWSADVADLLGIPLDLMPRIVDSSGVLGNATALPGAPPIAGLVGDQQASLIGQGCIRPGQAKITFGTGGMLDVCTGFQPPPTANRSEHGTFPIVAWATQGSIVWGAEAIMLSAGSNVEWLVDDLGLIESPADSHDLAASVESSDGVVYVPALLGLGTPHWDYGARGTLLGITRGTTRAHVVRAVLEGVAHRGADLVEAAQADTGQIIEALRVDGGMSQNITFIRALATAAGRPVEVSPVAEATTLGAAFLAGVAVDTWSSLEDATGRWRPAATIEPDGEPDRARWHTAVERASRWIPDLSALDF